ncbi:AraC family ligand binding domain-containing protein [Paenibacillus sp. CC-CFT747]|nr:AraC family ligand binding domain-containing protein [Paenibacillus sp. CC-CFT747]
MNGKQPNRLRKEQFLHSSSPLKLYRQEVGGRHELHWHEFYELCFITSGKGWNIVNGQKHPLTPGSLFLLTPADFHEIYADGSDSMRLFNLVFDEEMLSDELRGLLFADGRLLMADFTPTSAIRIQEEFERIEEETTDRRLGGSLMIRGAMERILLELARQSGVETEAGAFPPPAFSPIQKALVYMHHHFRDPLPLETAARQARLSLTTLANAFASTPGCPFRRICSI